MDQTRLLIRGHCCQLLFGKPPAEDGERLSRRHRLRLLATCVSTLGLFFIASGHSALAQQAGCLSAIEASESAEERAFDEHFDKSPSGERFSFELFIRASQAQSALDAFRLGVVFDSRSQIERVVQFPLSVGVYQDSSTRAETIIKNFDEWVLWKQQRFSLYHVAVVACANARTVRIYKNQGFAIGNGLVWFNGSIDDDNVKVIKINLYAMSTDDLQRECVDRLQPSSAK